MFNYYKLQLYKKKYLYLINKENNKNSRSEVHGRQKGRETGLH